MLKHVSNQVGRWGARSQRGVLLLDFVLKLSKSDKKLTLIVGRLKISLAILIIDFVQI